MRARWVFLAALAVVAPVSAAAQTTSAGVTFDRYAFATPAALDIESLALLSVRFGASVTAGRGFVFGLNGALADASLVREDGTEATVSGLTDTEVSARYTTAGGGAALTALVLLPTGGESLAYDEMFVAGAIAADVLPFAVRDFGTGGGAGASVALARPFGAFAAGVSVGYVVAREYEPLSAEAFEYRPGDQLHVRMAVDRTIGRSAKVALRADWLRYGDDEGNGANVFQPGDRLQVIGSYDFAVGRSSAIAYAGWLRRGEGEYVAPPDILSAQDLLLAGGGMRLSLGSTVLVPSIDVRVLESDGADRRGYTLGLGAAVEGRVGAMAVQPDVRVRLGRVEVRDGEETGFTGVNVGLTIRFGEGVR